MDNFRGENFKEGLKDRFGGVLSGFKREQFSMQKHGDGYDQVGGFDDGGIGGGGGGGGYDANIPGSPDSFEEIERPPLRKIDKYTRAECPCLSQRYTIAVMACLGFIISFGMRCNMGMAKLQLENKPVHHHHELNHSHHLTTPNPIHHESNHHKTPSDKQIHHLTTLSPTHHNHPIQHHDDLKSSVKEGVTNANYHWSTAMESAVDSSFFWGYLVTQIPGGFLTSIFPANRLFGTAIAISAFLNLFLPVVFEEPGIIIIFRVMQGLVEGVTYPACHAKFRIWRFWAPPLERSRLATVAFSGSYAGVVIGMPMSGILASWVSWKAAFIFYGIMGLIWYCFWLWLSFEKPRYHPAISMKELKYIEKSLGNSVNFEMPKISTTPWHEIAHSMPVIAIIVANFCRSWNFYLLVLYQSKYLKHVHNFDLAEAGFYGALPHLLMTLIVPFGGMLADHLRKNGIMSTTNVRKLFNCGGFGLEGLFFLFVAHSKSAEGALTALTIGVAASGFAISGYNVNHLDIAPRYASILMGMSNGIGTIAGLLCPVAIDYLTSDRNDKGAWTTVFTIAACVHLFGISFYGYFASGELQPWAEPIQEEQQAWDPMENATGPVQETSFNNDQDAMAMQLNPNQMTYGSTETAPTNPFNQQQNYNNTSNMFNNQMPPQQMPMNQNPFNPSPANPFANPNAYVAQPTQVQPFATDAYTQ